MTDNFFFSGLEGRWFDNCFEPYHLFGYIGDRENIDKYQKEKPFWRHVVEIMAPSISLTSIVTKLAGFNLGIGGAESKVAKQIIDLINERENKRLVNDFLRIAQKRCRKEGHFFDAVRAQYNRTNAVKSADQPSMDNHLIVVEGQLLHRSAVAQFAPNSAQQLQASKEEWLLGDFPPHGMVERNERFKGDLLRLKEDEGFSDTFADYIPFCRDMAWYPYCRITGFYYLTRVATEVFPELSIALVEYRRPKLYNEVGAEVIQFLDHETQRPNFLAGWSDRLLAAYLLPLVTRASNMKQFHASAEQKDALRNFVKFVGGDMPRHLVSWYQSAISAKDE